MGKSRNYFSLDEKKLFFSEHHLSHAASAFYPSPFKEAIIVTADGVGEWGTTTVAIGKENKLEIVALGAYPSSGLKKGVVVHIHDIFTPRDYLDQWIREDVYFWNEQIHNSQFTHPLTGSPRLRYVWFFRT